MADAIPRTVSRELQFDNGRAIGISKQNCTQNPRKSWGFCISPAPFAPV
jgi:hypothetical protein